MQGIIRNLVTLQVMPDLGLGPVGQRIELLHAVCGVVFLHRQFGTGGRLRTALSGDPGGVAGERAIQRLDLADAAAFLAHLDTVIERVQAIGRHIGIDRRRLGLVQRNLIAIGVADAVDHAQRLCVQSTRLEREDPDRQLRAQDQVGQHHVLGGEAGREHGWRKLGGNARQRRLRIGEHMVEMYAVDVSSSQVGRAHHASCAAGRAKRRNSGVFWSHEVW